MTTFADVYKAADGTLSTFVDDERLPAGHFGATAFIDGELVGYLFEGKQDSPEATLKGRVEYTREDGKLTTYAFATNNLTGGTPLGPITDWQETFAQMV